mmetsp:Transcript_38942/g.91704  ORF Transcript_38942/g.91704 Transcript_38942/m.91704 type:complete len:236 (-) Transcript_38942:212-919(-)
MFLECSSSPQCCRSGNAGQQDLVIEGRRGPPRPVDEAAAKLKALKEEEEARLEQERREREAAILEEEAARLQREREAEEMELRREQEVKLEEERRRAWEAEEAMQRELQAAQEERQRQEEAAAAKQRQVEEEQAAREKERKDAQKAEEFLKEKGYLEARAVRTKCFCLNRRTILHEAVQEGDADLIRTLLAMQADPDLKNARKQTPLELAHKIEEQQPAACGSSWAAVFKALGEE